MPAKKISERSTKQEIWEAYNNLTAEIEEQPVLPMNEQKPMVSEALHTLSDLKIKISQDLDKISGNVTKEIDNFSEIQTKIIKDKRAMLELFDLEKRKLEEEMRKVETIWEEKAKEHEKAGELLAEDEIKKRNREEEEYKYTLALNRRKEQDEYESKRIEREKILSEKEKILLARSNEITSMEKEVKEMPEKLKDVFLEAKNSTTKELTDKYTIEIRELKMLHDHEKKVSELKIANLESLVKSQTAEIESLKHQIENSIKQVKDIAVSVIEGRAAKSNQSIPQPETASK